MFSLTANDPPKYCSKDVEDLGILQFSYYDYLFASISGSSKPAK